MKRLIAYPMPGGDLSVWEMPRAGNQYIITCDPSLGRSHTEGGDHSAVIVWKRWPGRIVEQVAELYCRVPIGRVGEAIACLARAYGNGEDDNATVNVERNLSDAIRYAMLETQEFPDDSLFVPRNDRSAIAGDTKVYFTPKDHKSEHYLINSLVDFLDRKAIIIRSKRAINDIRSLEKRNDGSVSTTGHDLAVAVILGCVTEQEMPALEELTEKEAKKDPKDCPPGFDRELWAKKYAKAKKRLPSSFSWQKQSI